MRTRFILIETSHAGNVGASARAIKTMGFDDLVLVRPRFANVLRREETIQRASGANDVLEHCRIVESLEQALDGITHVCATVMTARDFGPATFTPRAHLPSVAASSAGTGTSDAPAIAFLFGCERFGMRNEDVYRCHAALQIPTNPHFGSLNLAAAVQLIAYEWRLALDSALDVPSAPVRVAAAAEPLADAQEIAAMLAHWQQALVAVGYLDPAAPRKLMPRLQQLFYRAQLRREEIHILRGIAKAMQHSSTQSGDATLELKDV